MKYKICINNVKTEFHYFEKSYLSIFKNHSMSHHFKSFKKNSTHGPSPSLLDLGTLRIHIFEFIC